MGKIADAIQNLQIAFIVPLIAYTYVGFYGWEGHKIARSRLIASA
jgi:fucose permease